MADKKDSPWLSLKTYTGPFADALGGPTDANGYPIKTKTAEEQANLDRKSPNKQKALDLERGMGFPDKN